MIVHAYWLLLLTSALFLLPLLWLGRKNRWWLLALIPCLAMLAHTRLEISAYYKGVNLQANNTPNSAFPVSSPPFQPQQEAQAERFLESIRRPLMPLDQLPQPKDWRQALLARLTEDFAQDKQLILDFHPDLTEREALVFYLTARVHGNMPTYSVRGYLPLETEILLFAPQGNCVDHAARLMMVADTFGIATARITHFTPSLPGHALVEAYDPKENTAYLLDATTNVIMLMRNPHNQGGVLQQLLDMQLDDRTKFLKSLGGIRSMPYRFYYVDPGISQFSGNNLKLNDINVSQQETIARYIKSFEYELDHGIELIMRSNTDIHYPLNIKHSKEAFPGFASGFPLQHILDTTQLLKFYGFDEINQYQNGVHIFKNMNRSIQDRM
ncbi:MAG: hypothetical protein FWG04_00375 [Desulfovibrionaceae bacterium]|nr:hypothetical protein [Desulfovibrionaceae bacterium]